MRIEELPLDPEVVEALRKRGIEQLYPPQEEAIRRGLLEGRNLVVAAPTAAGKTLIAELAMVNTARRGRKAIYLVPLKAIASEKYAEFSEAWRGLGIRTAVSVGDYDSSDAHLAGYDVIISTYEKMDSLLRHHAPWLADVGLVVVDEIHYIDDPKRGPTLEMLVAHLKNVLPEAQLLALSATIGNVEELAEWLDAEPVVSGWRPVPLREGVYHGGRIYYADGQVETVPGATGNAPRDLVNDTLRKGGQALVFVNSRRRAVSLASLLADTVSRHVDPQAAAEYADMLRRESESKELAKLLGSLVERGVAFHHAGLSYVERRIVEEAFRNNAVKAVVATPTLGAGVNLPARRVVIDSYTRYEVGLGRMPIKVMEYKQFAGRAGRPGYDEVGEAILVASRSHEVDELLENYIFQEPEPVYSKMGTGPAVRSHVLAAIASHGYRTREDLARLMGLTLYASQYGTRRLAERVDRTLKYLVEKGFVEESGRILAPTRLGLRVSELYIDPRTAETVLRGLRLDRPKATALGYLHLIAMTPDMPRLPLRSGDYRRLEALLDAHYPELILRPEDVEILDREDYREYLAALKTALMLSDWINELDMDTLLKRYDVGPGDVRAYAETAAWLAYAAAELSRLEKPDKYPDLSNLHLRVKHGVKEELLELVKVPGIGRVRARRLYDAGIRGVEDLRRADPVRILSIASIGPETLKRILEYVGSDKPAPQTGGQRNARRRGNLLDYM